MYYALTVLYSQLFVTLPYPTSDFTDQVIIVTGSNTGLGLEAVKHLIRLNAAHIILVVRSTTKGAAAVEHTIATTQCAPDRLSVWPLDLSSYASVKAFGERVRQELDRLDAVIQNAGVLTSKWALAEGNESHITTNVVSPLLLGLVVLPKLRESARKTGMRGRLTFNGSDTHYVARFAEKDRKPGGSLFDALNDEKIADMHDRYQVSKLLLLQTSWFMALLMNIVTALIARSTEAGSRALVHGIAPELGPEARGAFLMDCKIAPNGKNVEGPENTLLQERFRKELFAVLEQISPGITAM